MTASRSPAVLFDIDGTLVDSNYLHVHAWARAFSDVGIAADAWRIHRSIGMDGSTLVKTLSGDADDELSILREVLDRDNLVSEMTLSADVDTAKPKPDIINVALDRAGATDDRAVFVGDSVWDAETCRRAGIPSIGVLSGDISREELIAGGARE